MRQLLTHTVWLGSSFAVTVLCGIVTAKVVATLVGPHGYGLFGLYATLSTLFGILAGFGVGNALTRVGSEVWANGDMVAWYELRAVAVVWIVLSGTAAGLLLVLLRDPLGIVFLGGPLTLYASVLLASNILFGLIIGLGNAILKTERRLAALAWVDSIMTALMSVITIGCVATWHVAGILPALSAGGLVGAALMAATVQVGRGAHRTRRPSGAVMRCRARQLRAWAPHYAASTLITAGSRMVAPLLILHQLGTSAVGLYTTASTIGIVYLGALVSVMGRDYFPRLAATPTTRHDHLLELLRNQQQLVYVLGLPMILIVLTVARLVLPLVYTPRFLGMVPLLQWTVTGDLFRFLAATYSLLILAKAPGRIFLRLQLIEGALIPVATWFGLSLGGLQGIGVSYLVCQIILCATAWAFSRYYLGVSWPDGGLLRLMAACGILGLSSVILNLAGSNTRLLLMSALTSVIVALSLRRIHEYVRPTPSAGSLAGDPLGS